MRTRAASMTGWGSIVSPRGADPAPARPRYRELDGHRGLAVLAAVVFEVYQFCNVDHFLYQGSPAYTLLSSLDAAVPWFFVLTAFLVFEPIARSIVDGGRPVSGRAFLARRAVRILPAYVVAVAVVWFLRQPSLPGDWRDILEHLTFTQVFDPKRVFFTIGPAWAVSVAVHFYLLLALVTVGLTHLCRRLPTRAGRVAVLAAVTLALGAVSPVWRAWSFGVGQRTTTGSFTTWFGPAANLDSFALGMGVAVVVAGLGGTRPLAARGRTVLRLTGLALLAAAALTRRADTWSGVYFSSICAAGFACLVAAAVLAPETGRWSRLARSRPLRGLGTIGLGVFLWHEPITLALNGSLVRQAPDAFVRDTVVVLTASVLVGWIVHLAIERPTGPLAGMFSRDAAAAARRPRIPSAGGRPTTTNGTTPGGAHRTE